MSIFGEILELVHAQVIFFMATWNNEKDPCCILLLYEFICLEFLCIDLHTRHFTLSSCVHGL